MGGGAKTELFEGRLTGSLAYFQLTKQNISVTDPRDVPLFRFSIPIGEVQTRGVELDISGEILPDLRIIAAYAHIDSEVLEDSQDTLGGTGAVFSKTPEDSGSLWLMKEWNGGPLAGLSLGAGALFRSPQANLLGANANAPGYATVNLAVGYSRKLGPSKVSVQLNIDNLLDKEYFESFDDFAFFPGVPRTFLGQIRVEF